MKKGLFLQCGIQKPGGWREVTIPLKKHLSTRVLQDENPSRKPKPSRRTKQRSGMLLQWRPKMLGRLPTLCSRRLRDDAISDEEVEEDQAASRFTKLQFAGSGRVSSEVVCRVMVSLGASIRLSN